SSQPMHFSSPSGHRLSWWRPWNRGAVGRFSSGYWTVSTLRNICRKVTPKPLTGLANSGTGDLLDGIAGGGAGIGRGGVAGAHGSPGGLRHTHAVVVRQVQRRDGESGAAGRCGGRPVGGRLGHGVRRAGFT